LTGQAGGTDHSKGRMRMPPEKIELTKGDPTKGELKKLFPPGIVKGKNFQATFDIPAKTLKMLSPDIVEKLVIETGSKVLGTTLLKAMKEVAEMAKTQWTLSFIWTKSSD